MLNIILDFGIYIYIRVYIHLKHIDEITQCKLRFYAEMTAFNNDGLEFVIIFANNIHSHIFRLDKKKCVICNFYIQLQIVWHAENRDAKSDNKLNSIEKCLSYSNQGAFDNYYDIITWISVSL